MNNEIKEILKRIEGRKNWYLRQKKNNGVFNDEDYMAYMILDYITNLQGQLHQASLDIQELTERDLYCPTNCDKLTKLQKENEYLKKNQRFHKRFKEDSIFCLEYDKETLKDLVFELQHKINKAIEYIEENVAVYAFNNKKNPHWEFNDDNIEELLNILKGDSNE